MTNSHTITCPICDGEGINFDAVGDDDQHHCPECFGFGEIHHDPRLEGRTTCAACHRSYTWGCGHSREQESDALDHQDTTEHLLGDCDCYVSRPGYAAFYTRDERRDRIAALLREIEAADRPVMFSAGELQEKLYR